MNAGGLSAGRMQAIAREFNLSETTFVERRAVALEQAEGVRVRIFTPKEELAFAGHPRWDGERAQAVCAGDCGTGDGDSFAERGSDSGAVCRGRPVWRDEAAGPEFGAELNPAEVARLTGLGEDDLDSRLPPQVVSTGTAFAIVPLRTPEALARLKVSQEEASQWLRERGARWFYALGPTGAQEPAWRARMQFYGGEDPATGSAAGCAISYLVGGARRRG